MGYSAGSPARQDSDQATFRDFLAQAARDAGLNPDSWEIQSSGDGVLAVLPPEEEEPVVVGDFVRHLNTLLRRRNRGKERAERLRLRVAVHFGAYAPGGNGYVGKAPILTGRLVDAEPARRAIAQATGAHLVLVVSDEVYQASVATELTDWDPDEFREVPVAVKTYKGTAWLLVPGVDAHGLDLEPPQEAPAPAGAGVSTVINGSVRMGDNGVIGIAAR